MRALVLALLLALLPGPALSLESVQTGIASWYGTSGFGVASQWCTWTLRHESGCGQAIITSLDTGITVTAPVIDWCQCYRGTSDERIVDLLPGVVAALGLDPARGLYPVRVEWSAVAPVEQNITIPNTAMAR
jgi:hypothetical protein